MTLHENKKRIAIDRLVYRDQSTAILFILILYFILDRLL